MYCREQIAQEWMSKQEQIKSEEIEITYSYCMLCCIFSAGSR